ncbi:MAG: hypothetical protein ACKVX7_02125 [Planctomycetota bacterium]
MFWAAMLSRRTTRRLIWIVVGVSFAPHFSQRLAAQQPTVSSQPSVSAALTSTTAPGSVVSPTGQPLDDVLLAPSPATASRLQMLVTGRELAALDARSTGRFADIERGYREPHVIGSTARLPLTVFAYHYELAPYLVDRGDGFRSRTGIRPSFLSLEDNRGILRRQPWFDVEAAVAGSLAAVGRYAKAESFAMRCFVGHTRFRGLENRWSQESVSRLLAIYARWPSPTRRADYQRFQKVTGVSKVTDTK